MAGEAHELVLLDDLVEVSENEVERLLLDHWQVELLGDVVHVDAVRHRGQLHEVVTAQVDGLGHLQVCGGQQNVVDVLDGAAQLTAVGKPDHLL